MNQTHSLQCFSNKVVERDDCKGCWEAIYRTNSYFIILYYKLFGPILVLFFQRSISYFPIFLDLSSLDGLWALCKAHIDYSCYVLTHIDFIFWVDSMLWSSAYIFNSSFNGLGLKSGHNFTFLLFMILDVCSIRTCVLQWAVLYCSWLSVVRYHCRPSAFLWSLLQHTQLLFLISNKPCQIDH